MQGQEGLNEPQGRVCVAFVIVVHILGFSSLSGISTETMRSMSLGSRGLSEND